MRANRVAHLAIDGQLFFGGAGGCARVGKAPVQTLPGAEKDRAGFIGRRR